jgi:hypothetical protein
VLRRAFYIMSNEVDGVITAAYLCSYVELRFVVLKRSFMASNTKITETRRKNRDKKLLARRQVALKKVFKAAKKSFDAVFGQ